MQYWSLSVQQSPLLQNRIITGKYKGVISLTCKTKENACKSSSSSSSSSSVTYQGRCRGCHLQCQTQTDQILLAQMPAMLHFGCKIHDIENAHTYRARKSITSSKEKWKVSITSRTTDTLSFLFPRQSSILESVQSFCG